MSGSPHPDYLAALEGQRWARPLDDLVGFLRKEAWKSQGKWVFRLLPHGALVAMRVVDETGGPLAFNTELRIARKEDPATPEARKKWETEVGVFLKHFGADTWELVSDDPLKANVVYRALFLRKPPKPEAACEEPGCGQPCEPGPYHPNRCLKHATEAGAKGP
jgi:hypothetical protein